MRGTPNQVWLFGKPYLWEADGEGRLYLRPDAIQTLLHTHESRRRYRQFIAEEKFSTEVGLSKSPMATQAALYMKEIPGSWWEFKRRILDFETEVIFHFPLPTCPGYRGSCGAPREFGSDLCPDCTMARLDSQSPR